MTLQVYGLIDPRYGEVRYVGATGVSLKTRLSYHVAHARSGRFNTHRDNWISGLLQDGLTPRIVLLDECTDEADAAEAERWWIAAYDGLTNASEGGESLSSGWRHTEATREKIREGLIAYSAANPQETCSKGHPLDGIKKRSGTDRMKRYCKTCSRENEKRLHPERHTGYKQAMRDATRCKRGHEFTEENTIHRGNQRQCRICFYTASIAQYQRKLQILLGQSLRTAS